MKDILSSGSLKDLAHHPKRSSYADLGAFFHVLNDPTDFGRNGALRGTRYVNDSLFSHAAKVHLDPRELAVLVEAAHSGWGKVDPAIFGSLMEGCLGRDRRWELGAGLISYFQFLHLGNLMFIIALCQQSKDGVRIGQWDRTLFRILAAVTASIDFTIIISLLFTMTI